MAKSKPDEPLAPEAPPTAGLRDYLHWARDPAMGLFAVLPLWLVYEVLRWRLSPDDRNGAELLLVRALYRLGPAHWVLSIGFCVLTLVAARELVRRQVPWLRVAIGIAVEGTVYALLLGRLAAELTSSAERVLAAAAPLPDASLAANLVGSLGAGIFEELVFRLGLMSALFWLGVRATRTFSLPGWLAGVFAVVVSALVFSWFHHFWGEPFDRRRFLFRTMAGVLLGLIMWARGYGVCVYTHAIYDLHFYLVADDQ